MQQQTQRISMLDLLYLLYAFLKSGIFSPKQQNVHIAVLLLLTIKNHLLLNEIKLN